MEKFLKVLLNILKYAFLLFWAALVLFPFFYMILTSFKSFSSYNSEYVPRLYLVSPTFDNYVTALTEVKLLSYMLNTFIYAVVTTFLMVVVSVLAAYAFARLKFKGKNLIFVLFLALMMIPVELVIITNYTTIVNLNLRNTFVGLILPSVTSVFFIYLLKENFALVPDSLYNAARLDGCTDLRYMLEVVVPINKATVISVTILKLIECWNMYIWARLVTTEEGRYLVSNGIQVLRTSGFGRDNVPVMMAAVVIVSLPLVIVYLIFRRQIMAGVQKSGIKGGLI